VSAKATLAKTTLAKTTLTSVDLEERRTLGRTAAWLARQVELGLASADLSLSQYRVLGFLDESSAVSSDLAERLAVRPPSVTAVVDGLVGRGLVERRNVVADRRQVDHVLTESGRCALDTADAAVASRLRDIASCLGDDAETRRAFDGLLAWKKAFGAYRLARSTRR
jgi:DNA-binding MarR family transcriptional regulator